MTMSQSAKAVVCRVLAGNEGGGVEVFFLKGDQRGVLR
jgi:hypothetical protein